MIMQTIDELCNTYFYVSFGNSQFQFPWIAAVIVAFELLLFLVALLFVYIFSCRQTGKEKAMELLSEYEDIVYFEEVKKPVEVKTLDQVYAEKWNLIICPFCETFNSPKNNRCCACGQIILKRGV